ncbi:hypothetical protein GWI33_005153 [Rhynchophorus ferrugineus]|uniref:Uncharacterized protein n=1 Tax=Rhynchophorus ferrugineus TaxID=354439 RepID=A0A834INJ7_RHYFE|nr:hypothetical protein GWI33_005153 [Rhynchophorus ferrugineus]
MHCDPLPYSFLSPLPEPCPLVAHKQRMRGCVSLPAIPAPCPVSAYCQSPSLPSRPVSGRVLSSLTPSPTTRPYTLGPYKYAPSLLKIDTRFVRFFRVPFPRPVRQHDCGSGHSWRDYLGPLP